MILGLFHDDQPNMGLSSVLEAAPIPLGLAVRQADLKISGLFPRSGLNMSKSNLLGQFFGNRQYEYHVCLLTQNNTTQSNDNRDGETRD